MLILVPIMYDRETLKQVLGLVPDDFDDSSSEYWDYVETKLEPFTNKVHAIYTEKPIVKDRGDRMDAILKKFEGAEFHSIEDPLLTAETEAWLELMKHEENQMVRDLLEENLGERDRHVCKILDRTLEDGKLGLLFLDPTRKIPTFQNTRIVRMCPFDPVDYLNRYLVKLRITKKGNSRAD